MVGMAVSPACIVENVDYKVVGIFGGRLWYFSNINFKNLRMHIKERNCPS
jgi:hypothetical protein